MISLYRQTGRTSGKHSYAEQELLQFLLIFLLLLMLLRGIYFLFMKVWLIKNHL